MGKPAWIWSLGAGSSPESFPVQPCDLGHAAHLSGLIPHLQFKPWAGRARRGLSHRVVNSHF